MFSIFFCVFNKSFFYIEYDFIILYSYLGILKVKNSYLTSSFMKINTLLPNNMYNFFLLFFKLNYLLVKKGYINKFKLVGVGYRQFYSNNIVVYKLRYSHLVYNMLPFSVLTFKKHKRRTFFTLFSLNKNELNRIMHIWLSYRITNVYTKKGFFKKNKHVFFKEIVKKLL